jgi:hypothetical protein
VASWIEVTGNLAIGSVVLSQLAVALGSFSKLGETVASTSINSFLMIFWGCVNLSKLKNQGNLA